MHRDNSKSLIFTILTFLDASKGDVARTIGSRSRGLHKRPLRVTVSSLSSGQPLGKVARFVFAGTAWNIDNRISSCIFLFIIQNQKRVALFQCKFCLHFGFFAFFFFSREDQCGLLDHSPKTWMSVSPQLRAWVAVLVPKRESTALNPFWDLRERTCFTRLFPMAQEGQ